MFLILAQNIDRWYSTSTSDEREHIIFFLINRVFFRYCSYYSLGNARGHNDVLFTGYLFESVRSFDLANTA